MRTKSALGRARARSARALASIVAVGSLTAFASVVTAPVVSAVAVPCDAASLVAAVTAVATAGGTVTLTAGCTYSMTAVNNTADGNNAFPDITGNVTIIGSGATITRSGSNNFRFFLVDNSGTMDISNVTLSNGNILAGDPHGGAAILNRGSLTATGVTFTGNQSLAIVGGGAIDNHDLGILTVNGSVFTSNVGLQGGAIEDEGTLCHTSVQVCGSSTIINSTFTGNSTTSFGGGAVEVQLDQTGLGIPPVCTGPWPQSVSCQEAGGAHDTISGTTFSGNSSVTEGGGIANFGTATVHNSTLYNNTAGASGGGGVQNTGNMSIVQTTFSGNTSAFGANLHNFNDIANPGGPPVTTLAMSIVTAGVTGTNCSGSIVFTDGGYNLDSATSCGFSTVTHSLNSTNPMLGALASNGGTTQTMKLGSSSPAIDAIPTSFGGCTGSLDQRGVSRPQGTACDMGAYEVSTTAPAAPSGLLATPVLHVNQVNLSWNASAGPAVTGYTIYRDGSSIGSTAGLTFSDSTVAALTTYSYTVDAVDGDGNHSAQTAAQVVLVSVNLYKMDSYGGITDSGSPVTTTGSWPGWSIARSAHPWPLSSVGAQGFTLDGYGGMHPFGAAGLAETGPNTHYWGVDIARDFAFLPNGTGGFILDGYGGLHPFHVNGDTSALIAQGNSYWGGWDIARKVVIFPDATGGYVMDAYGGLHPFGINGPTPAGEATVAATSYFGWNIARDVVLVSGNGNHSGYLLDGYGGLHPFHPTGDGSVMPTAISAVYIGWDILRSLAFLPGSTTQGFTLDGYGGLHAFGGAPGLSSAPYYGIDIARDIWTG